jgi:hypothetical protein
MASINFFYQSYATQFMSLNLEDSCLFISIPSEKDDNKFYRVELNEETMQATSCNCPGHRRWGHCKHAEIVNSAFSGYKAPAAAPVESKVTEVEAGEWYIVNADTQVWMNEGQWIAAGPTSEAIEIVKAHLEKQSAVAEAESIVAPKRATYWDNMRACECYVDTRKPTGNLEGIDFGSTPMRWNAEEECFEAEESPKVTDISTKGSLTRKSGFQLLKQAV